MYKFSKTEKTLASISNLELQAKYAMAVAGNYDVILDPPAEPIQVSFSPEVLSSGNWGYDFLRTGVIADKIKSGKKPVRKILYAVVDTMAYPVHRSLLGDFFVPQQYCLDHTTDRNGIDGHGHGHHVAGTILGDPILEGYRLGIGRVDGWNLNDKILGQKGLNSNGSGMGSWLVSAINHALNVWKDKFKDYELVFNFSWGSNSPSTNINAVIDSAVSAGAYIVAAAGNNGQPKMGWPASHPKVISVGACDLNGVRASFSQYDDNLEVIAPGVGIWSCYKSDGAFTRWSGTSMATPHAAAALGHVLKWFPDINGFDDLMTFIKENSLDAGPAGKDPQYGYGYPDLKSYIVDGDYEDKPEDPGDDKPEDPKPPTKPDPDRRSEYRDLEFTLKGDWRIAWTIDVDSTGAKSKGVAETFTFGNLLRFDKETTFFEGTRWAKVKEIKVTTNTNAWYEKAFTELMGATDRFFTNRGILFKKPEYDLWDLCYWTSFFYDLILNSKEKIVIDVEYIVMEDENGVEAKRYPVYNR